MQIASMAADAVHVYFFTQIYADVYHKGQSKIVSMLGGSEATIHRQASMPTLPWLSMSRMQVHYPHSPLNDSHACRRAAS